MRSGKRKEGKKDETADNIVIWISILTLSKVFVSTFIPFCIYSLFFFNSSLIYSVLFLLVYMSSLI